MRKTARKPRGGVLLICVLVCLLVATALVTSTVGSALRSRRNVQRQHQMRQTELLLDAGVLRAARQLQKSNDYQGESWRPTGALPRFDNPLVEIRITADDNEARLVEVVASLGVAVDDVEQNIASLTRRTHTYRIQRPEFSSTSDSPQTSESPSAE